MKGIFSTILFLMVAQLGFAVKHVKFDGIPLGGPKQKFEVKLQKKGFQSVPCPDYLPDTVAYNSYYWGTYSGFSNSIVIVKDKRDEQKLVDKVVVMLDESNSWRALYDYYAKVKQQLTRQYGQPKECREMFHINGQPKTDSDLFQEVKNGNCEYVSIFSSKSGAVVVNIYFYNRQARVFVSYIDNMSMKGVVQKMNGYQK